MAAIRHLQGVRDPKMVAALRASLDIEKHRANPDSQFIAAINSALAASQAK